jgi:hypothetical protein
MKPGPRRRSSPYKRLITLPVPRVAPAADRSDDVETAIFVDYSNIARGLRAAADSSWEGRSARVNFAQLLRLLTAGRPGSRTVLVTDAEEPAGARRAMADAGFEVIERERGRLSGTEQANDETLQVRMYETVAALEPGVLVLATGDGAGASYGRGFIPALAFARAHGWAIELASWTASTNQRLNTFVRQHEGQVVSLDDYYFGLSEVPGLRAASQIPLCHRPTADSAVHEGAQACRSSHAMVPGRPFGSAA